MKPRQHHNVTLMVLAVSALAYALSQTMVAPALPEIQHELHTSATSVTWVLTIYLLTASVATPIVGRLGDMFGKERMLLVVLSFFALGSLVAAVSHSIPLLVAGRAIQGIGGAVFPLAFGIIRDEFPREKVATAIGLISATFGIGGGAGLVLSGVIVDNLAYEWIFWLALVVVSFAMVMTHLFVPESPVKSPARIDWGGAALLSGGLIALLAAVSEGNRWGWDSAPILGLFALAAVLLVGLVRYELGFREPLVDMRMMRSRPVLATNVTGLLIGFGMFGSFILTPQLVQTPESTGFGFGASVTEAGLFMLPSTAVMLVAGPIAGAVGTRWGSKLPLLAGTLVTATALGFLAILHEQAWAIYVGTSMIGLGIGFSFASMANLVVESVDQRQTGIASGMNTIMRTIGGSIGGQIAASVVAGHLVDGLPSSSGFTMAYAIAAVAVLVAFLCGLAIPSRRPAEVVTLPGAREPAEVEVPRAAAG